jgi:hypothetical protein
MGIFRLVRIWILVGLGLSALLAACRRGTEPAKAPPTADRAIDLGSWESRDFHEYWNGVPQRKVFPYSVIPGGVESPEDLKVIIKRDPEIARHLRDFNLQKAMLVKLRKPRAAYVSYRKGDLIYWTRKRVTLAEGELVITDGIRTIRTRCGNDVSDAPKEPTSPSEPATRELETPIPLFPLPPVISNIAGPPVFPPIVAPPGTYFPPPVFIPPGGSLPPRHGPPVSTPEPSTFLFLCFGAAGILAKSISRKRAR